MKRLIASLAVWVAAAGALAAQPTPKEPPPTGGVLVFTAEARDYVFGAGGTLAKFAAEGKPVIVAHFGNGEKAAPGVKASEARLIHRREAEAAAKALGVTETLFLGHKSGEIAYLSSSELRNQAITLTRFYKPEVVFFPDWYIHFQREDSYRVGRMAEEAPYGGGNLFLQEMTYMGLLGHGARRYYFYSPYRPYRDREGGEGGAQFVGVDIEKFFEQKVAAVAALKSANQREMDGILTRLKAAGKPIEKLNKDGAEGLASVLLRELAFTIGNRHGFALAEEFNHLGGSGGLPPHIKERAR
jgi:N-acetylglucosamine malate deacetylase 1